MTMPAVPSGRQSLPFFIQIAVRDIENQKPTSFYDAPPIFQCDGRVWHVFKGVRGINEIERVITYPRQKLRIPIFDIPTPAVFSQQIATITNIQANTGTIFAEEAFKIPTRTGLCGFRESFGSSKEKVSVFRKHVKRGAVGNLATYRPWEKIFYHSYHKYSPLIYAWRRQNWQTSRPLPNPVRANHCRRFITLNFGYSQRETSTRGYRADYNYNVYPVHPYIPQPTSIAQERPVNRRGKS